MWSSVRRYRGRNNRDDDFSFTCTCITDWCFTWCSNQCTKKPDQRPSLSSQASNESEPPQASRCCNVGTCFVRTTQVGHNGPGSQVLQEDLTETEQIEWASQSTAIEADPAKTESSLEDDNDTGYWAFLRRLRRFRPRFFGGRTTVSSVTSEVKAAQKLSGLQRLGLWFRHFGQRPGFASSSPNVTASPSAVIAEEVTEEANITETDEERVNQTDVEDGSPWGTDPFIVFARGKCGYESFDPNCCRLWQTINYSFEEHSVTDICYNNTALEDRRPVSATRDYKVPDVAKPGCKRPIDGQKLKHMPHENAQQMAPVTMITVASELETHTQKRIVNDSSAVDDECKDMPHSSKQTQVHTPDILDTGRDFMGIEESGVARDIVNLIGPASMPSSESALIKHTEPVPMLQNFPPKIPEVILQRAATPDTRTEGDCTTPVTLNKHSSKPLQRQSAIDSDYSTSTKHEEPKKQEDQDSDSVKANILNFMIKSPPKRIASAGIRIEASKSSKTGAGNSDVRKKIVRFKVPSFGHSTTKGRAVYIGTSKHASAPKREIIDCLSMTVERRRVTVEETQVSSDVSFHESNPVRTVPNQSHSQGPGDSEQTPRECPGSPKGVKEYVSEYSELCKASVDQERQILQTVIDSVRECYKMPTSLEDKKELKEINPKDN